MTHMDKRDGVDRSGIIRAREWEHNTEPPPLTEASWKLRNASPSPPPAVPSSGTVAFPSLYLLLLLLLFLFLLMRTILGTQDLGTRKHVGI